MVICEHGIFRISQALCKFSHCSAMFCAVRVREVVIIQER